jgi:hypothetical protein
MGLYPRPDPQMKRPVPPPFVEKPARRAAKMIDIALPRPFDLAAVRPEQRAISSQRKLVLLGSSRQIGQISARRVDVASLFRMQAMTVAAFPAP